MISQNARGVATLCGKPQRIQGPLAGGGWNVLTKDVILL